MNCWNFPGQHRVPSLHFEFAGTLKTSADSVKPERYRIPVSRNPETVLRNVSHCDNGFVGDVIRRPHQDHLIDSIIRPIATSRQAQCRVG